MVFVYKKVMDKYLIPITISEIKERFPQLIIKPELESKIIKKKIYLDIRGIELETGILMKNTEPPSDDEFYSKWCIRMWEIELYKNYSILVKTLVSVFEDYIDSSVIRDAIYRIKEKELAPIMKYFPEWKNRIRKNLSTESKDRMEFYIKSCSVSEEKAKGMLSIFEKKLERIKESFPNRLYASPYINEEHWG